MVAGLMLRASSNVLSQAKDEISRKGYTPLVLANGLGLAVQLVENFLNGEIVDRNSYDLVCTKLNISDDRVSAPSPKIEESKSNISNSVQVADLTSTNTSTPLTANQGLGENLALSINQSWHELRQNISTNLIRQCDRLRVLDINNALYLHDLFVEINVFTNLSSSQYLDLHETFVNIPAEQYDRFYLTKLQPSTIPAHQSLEEHQQILLVGNLGTGKTTLLKYFALACITDKILPDYLPVYLPLRSLVTFNNQHDLNNPFTWLKSQLLSYALSDQLLNKITNSNLLDHLLDRGHFLLLWDGLDEIPEHDRATVAQQILNFSDRYPKNRMVCATRNPVYGHIFQSFQTVEIAPFQESQIISFADKWFQTTCSQKPKKLEKFQQLIATNQPLAEIVSNPLFLTYLCTIFNSCEYLKSNFYQDILNLQLTVWDQTKCLPSSANQVLSTAQKQDLLSYMAIVSLDRHGYLWQNHQFEDDFQDCIAASRTLSNMEINRDRLFQSLKWQHGLLVECAKGVYRLTHTTLHDYLAAYRIANSNPIAAQKYLLDRMYLNRWHGVIVMTVSISQQADRMLQMMKQKIDQLVTKDPHLQSFLTWVNQQSIQIKTPYKSVTIRALYLDIDLENTRSLDRARALDIAHSRSLERARMRSLGVDNTMETEVDIDYTINLALNLDLALYFADHPVLELACILEPDLNRGLQFLRQKFLNPYADREKFAKWWQAKGLDWSKKLRNLIVHHRKGSQEWKFSENQLITLRTYHDANKLLIECLNNTEHASQLVKGQIESALLLPQSEYNNILR